MPPHASPHLPISPLSQVVLGSRCAAGATHRLGPGPHTKPGRRPPTAAVTVVRRPPPTPTPTPTPYPNPTPNSSSNSTPKVAAARRRVFRHRAQQRRATPLPKRRPPRPPQHSTPPCLPALRPWHATLYDNAGPSQASPVARPTEGRRARASLLALGTSPHLAASPCISPISPHLPASPRLPASPPSPHISPHPPPPPHLPTPPRISPTSPYLPISPTPPHSSPPRSPPSRSHSAPARAPHYISPISPHLPISPDLLHLDPQLERELRRVTISPHISPIPLYLPCISIRSSSASSGRRANPALTLTLSLTPTLTSPHPRLTLT